MEITLQDKNHITDVEFSEVRRSVKQPSHVGFGYVIHLPLDSFKKVNSDRVNLLVARGMKVEYKQPVFLRTEMPYVKLSFHYGDENTAKTAFAVMSAYTANSYKNWL